MGLPGLAAGSTTMSKPFYRRVIADIRARIASGEWPPGHKLPTNIELRNLYRELFESPTLANATVQGAIRILQESGELRGQQGLGVFVPGSAQADDQVT
jgi:GntR family transcriptional regulator